MSDHQVWEYDAAKARWAIVASLPEGRALAEYERLRATRPPGVALVCRPVGWLPSGACPLLSRLMRSAKESLAMRGRPALAPMPRPAPPPKPAKPPKRTDEGELLRVLAERGPLPTTGIALAMGVKVSAVVRWIAPLERKGLIRGGPSGDRWLWSATTEVSRQRKGA